MKTKFPRMYCNETPVSPEAFYRRNLVIPFLDHITELTKRFGPIQQTKVKLLGLIPSVAATYPPASVTEVGELYKADLPSPHLLSTEFRHWKTKYSSAPSQSRPNTLEGALKSCDKEDFSNIFTLTLLVIACTLPVTTCETERSNGQLKLLKTYLRSTMTEKRLSSLALIKIHQDIAADLDFDKLVVDFANKQDGSSMRFLRLTQFLFFIYMYKLCHACIL